MSALGREATACRTVSRGSRKDTRRRQVGNERDVKIKLCGSRWGDAGAKDHCQVQDEWRSNRSSFLTTKEMLSNSASATKTRNGTRHPRTPAAICPAAIVPPASDGKMRPPPALPRSAGPAIESNLRWAGNALRGHDRRPPGRQRPATGHRDDLRSLREHFVTR